jgi:hypothetical protein
MNGCRASVKGIEKETRSGNESIFVLEKGRRLIDAVRVNITQREGQIRY